jgi:signal transduction histidine kinase
MTALAAQPQLATTAGDRLTPADLRELMQSVTDVTQRLQVTHVALHEQVARLQRELADANAALRRSQALAALGEMAAGIAHEVRNPLGSIQLYVRMLIDDLAERPQQVAICHKIENAVVSLDAIVRDVLSFAREARVQPERTTSTRLLARALESCASMINRGICVMLEQAPAHNLHADVGLMTQALGNVIRNAIEALLEAGTSSPQLRVWAVRRRMRCPDGHSAPGIALCVQDNGPGIPGEVRDRIFNPFFTTRSAGTGLGLAIVHRIVDAHGGHIVINSVQPTGTRVELCLPSRTGTSGTSPADCVASVSMRASALCSSSSHSFHPHSPEITHEPNSRR